MKLIIAGGRDYELTERDAHRLDVLIDTELRELEEVVHGGASGADAGGKAWAESRCFRTRAFPAKWNELDAPGAVIRTRRSGEKYNANAGPIRNAEMAAYADAVVLFPGGGGTASMYREAMKRGLKIFDFRGGAK